VALNKAVYNFIEDKTLAPYNMLKEKILRALAVIPTYP
jgi:hypothetical protein